MSERNKTNMPMRCLIYIGMLYSKYAEDRCHKINLYSSVLQKFPVPKIICFYNGTDEKEEKMILNLTDAFVGTDRMVPDVSVNVKMLNVNYGKNKELMEACQVLGEYAWFVDRVRRHEKEMDDLGRAVDMAIEELPENALIREFIMANKAEVRRMCITEYDEKRTMELFKEEARQEGRQEGRQA